MNAGIENSKNEWQDELGKAQQTNKENIETKGSVTRYQRVARLENVLPVKTNVLSITIICNINIVINKVYLARWDKVFILYLLIVA